MSREQLIALTSLSMRLSQENGGARRNLSGGVSSAFEHRALPYVARMIDDASVHLAGMRMCGIVASNPKTKHTSEKSFGACMRELTMKMTGELPSLEKPDRIANMLNQIQSQRLDQAAASINRLVKLAGDREVAVNFYSISDLLFFWGNGYTEGSRKSRRRTLRDYYSNTKTVEPTIITTATKELSPA